MLPSRVRWLGLLTMAGVLAGAWLMSHVAPQFGVLTFALVAGLVLRNANMLPSDVVGEIERLGPRLLRIGVVLLGLQLSVQHVIDLGVHNVLVVITTVVVTYVTTFAVARGLKLSRGVATLTATGFSICGASAIAAVSPVADAEERETALAVALVTIYGTVAIVLLPVLQAPLGLSDQQFGIWVGASVHEVAQVAATAAATGAVALSIAMVVKLTRVLMLAPLLTLLSLRSRSHARSAGLRVTLVPGFVAGFIAMLLIRSSGFVPVAALDVSAILCTVMLGCGLFALGAGVVVRSLLVAGGRSLALGLISTIVACLTALVGIKML